MVRGDQASAQTPPAATPVGFFEFTQRWFTIVKAHQIGQSDASVASVSAMSPLALGRVLADLDMIESLLDAAARKGDTAVDVPGRTLRLGMLAPLMGLTRDELDLPLGSTAKLAQLGDPTSHSRQVISRIMTKAAMLHTLAAIQLEGHQDDPTPPAGSFPSSTAIRPVEAAAVLRGGAVRIRDGQQVRVPNLAVHWAIARQAFDIVGPPRAGSPTAKLWYQAATAYLQQELNYSALLPLLQEARVVFPADARMFLFSGAAYENLAAPRVQSAVDDSPLGLPGVGSPEDLLRLAERYLRRALELDPRLALAQLRLGRVLDLTGRHDEAAKLLRQAESGLTDKLPKYLAALCLGHAEEALARNDDARAAYERAAALYPAAQNPTLALAALNWRTKSRDEAAAGLRKLAGANPMDLRNEPWWWYDSAHIEDVQVLFQRLFVSALEAVK